MVLIAHGASCFKDSWRRLDNTRAQTNTFRVVVVQDFERTKTVVSKRKGPLGD